MVIITGINTSEWAKALRAEIAAGVLVLLGVAVALAGGLLDRALLAGVGALFLVVGAWLGAHTGVAYVRARAAVKASAHAPIPKPRAAI